MKRPLSCATAAILLITIVSYSPTIACKDGEKTETEVTVTVHELPLDGDVAAVAICEISGTERPSHTATLKSSLRAGVAVGKAIGKTALVVATSVGRAARHATVALVQSVTALT